MSGQARTVWHNLYAQLKQISVEAQRKKPKTHSRDFFGSVFSGLFLGKGEVSPYFRVSVQVQPTEKAEKVEMCALSVSLSLSCLVSCPLLVFLQSRVVIPSSLLVSISFLSSLIKSYRKLRTAVYSLRYLTGVHSLYTTSRCIPRCL